MSLLRDEQGNISSMRTLLFTVIVPMLVAMTLLSASGVVFPEVAWTVWGGLATMISVGAFGPRIAQYLGPHVGTLVNAVRDSAIAKRRRNGDFEDTE